MRDRGTLFAVALVVVLVAGVGGLEAARLSPGAASVGPADSLAPVDPGVTPPIDGPQAGAPIQSCAAEPPPDFAPPADGNDVLGWVDGYWYSEPLAVTVDDGLNRTELAAVSARTAARFEAMRCLAATEGTPPIEVVTPAQFRASRSTTADGGADDRQLFDHATLSTLLLAGTETDPAAERDATRAVTVRGTYDYGSGTITIVRSDNRSAGLDESVLAHELGHAIQDQQFDIGRYDRQTTDSETALLGLIEGDVDHVAQRYRQACAADRWNEPCLTDSDAAGEVDDPDERADPENWGLYLMNFLPYNDGPRFVEHLQAAGGFERVDAAYENPPTSAVSIVDPTRYPGPSRGDVTVPDESSQEYERVTVADGPDYDTLGVTGIVATFMTPGFESEWAETIYRPREILNLDGSDDVDESHPLDYDQPVVAGWRDDKLYAYSHTATDEWGTVWRLQFADSASSALFLEHYREMIDYRDGTPVPGVEQTYSFEENDEYEMAVRLHRDGDRVTVVTAPTVPDLAAVHHLSPGEG